MLYPINEICLRYRGCTVIKQHQSLIFHAHLRFKDPELPANLPYNRKRSFYYCINCGGRFFGRHVVKDSNQFTKNPLGHF
ncbi:protein of unknown function [Candidatus Methylomirabilis oxygeniifera]|uniref:Uncharacterized protein n=1 Tax=Methylomirabilis oxygeniifera TaxID=671143 RepID=D5MJ95_METO1|nr:protein of unknown function [Candidatus Methylomirabilis oxyfera]